MALDSNEANEPGTLLNKRHFCFPLHRLARCGLRPPLFSHAEIVHLEIGARSSEPYLSRSSHPPIELVSNAGRCLDRRHSPETRSQAPPRAPCLPTPW